jgi:hypothetical protein
MTPSKWEGKGKGTTRESSKEKDDVLKDGRSMVFLEGKDGGVREHGSS